MKYEGSKQGRVWIKIRNFCLFVGLYRDLSIPTMKSLVTEKDEIELDKLTGFIQAQERFENKIKERVHQKMRIRHYPNRQTECKPPR